MNFLKCEMAVVLPTLQNIGMNRFHISIEHTDLLLNLETKYGERIRVLKNYPITFYLNTQRLEIEKAIDFSVQCEFLIITLDISAKKGKGAQNYCHANMLIYNTTNCSLERYCPTNDSRINDTCIDTVIQKRLSKMIPIKEYITPRLFDIINMNLQNSEVLEDDTRDGDPGGWCEAWAIFYVDMRIKYKTYTRYSLIKSIYQELSKITFKKFIRNYANHIVCV